EAGGRLALHALTREVFETGIDAGVDSIEHGFGLERALAEAMAEKGIALVPTMSAGAAPPSADAPADVRARNFRQPAQVRLVWEAGVVVLAGTDGAVPHGHVREEVRRLFDAGLPASA